MKEETKKYCIQINLLQKRQKDIAWEHRKWIQGDSEQMKKIK